MVIYVELIKCLYKFFFILFMVELFLKLRYNCVRKLGELYETNRRCY